MNCTQASEAISALLDGELEQGAVSEVQAHIAGCTRCETEQAALLRVDALADEALAAVEVDDLAWERTWQGINTELAQTPATSRGGSMGWAVAAAAVIVTVVGLSMIWRGGAPASPDRLALLETGGARMETMNGGGEDYIPFVMMTDEEVPVIYVIEAGE